MASLGTFISHLPINLKIYNVAKWTALNLGTLFLLDADVR